MAQPKLQNYLNLSPKTKTYSYRRRIPAKYKTHFLKANGQLRGNEWNESLKTKSMSRALKKGSEVNTRFEFNIELAKQIIAVSNEADNRTRLEKTKQMAENFRRLGIHPDQAPTVFESEEAANKFISKATEAINELRDYQEEVGLEVTGEFEDEIYTTNDTYKEMQTGIDFLKGDRTVIKHSMKVCWEAAVDEYLESKARLAGFPLDFNNKKPTKRVYIIANSFSKMLGRGSVARGNDRFLTDITRQEAKQWMDNELQPRTAVTVGREISILNAIINKAKTEYGNTDPDLRSYVNPFAGLRGECDKIDDRAVRTGVRTQYKARAWTPSEIDQFKQRYDKMNDEACICAKIIMFTGARLTDVCGLMVDDLVLLDEDNSQIIFQHNKHRKLSKDSIERKFPIYGEMLQDLKDYLEKRNDPNERFLTPKYTAHSNSSESLSNLLMKRHVHAFSTDKTLKIHGLRNTLQARFDAASFANKISGYLIGWKDQQTVGMQKAYKQGYPQSQMLEAVQKAHAVKEWAILAGDK